MARELAPLDTTLPLSIPIVTLKGRPIFPGVVIPVLVARSEVAEKIKENDVQVIGFLLTASAESDEERSRAAQANGQPDPADLYTIGTAARVLRKTSLPGGDLNLVVSTLSRFAVRSISADQIPYKASVSYIGETHYTVGTHEYDELAALRKSLLEKLAYITRKGVEPLFTEEMFESLRATDSPVRVADIVSSVFSFSALQQQALLEIVDPLVRLRALLVFLETEIELSKIQERVAQEINESVEKNQREYFLRRELKAIQKELGGEGSPEQEVVQKLRDLFEGKKEQMVDEVRSSLAEKLDRLSLLESSSSDYAVQLGYLELALSLPWGDTAAPDVSIREAQKILDKDHYGLQDVKERVLEHLAVSKQTGESSGHEGSIICLVGPPGVGKTSIGKSIARATGRKFYRFSVGGMRDESEIKGHRRTYVGAMPGKIIQGIKTTQTSNPVFMIDEIDKMGVSMQGDPSSALLEVLDPSQHDSFRDYYLDLPYDLSRILFVVTANTMSTIPQPLLDRMEIIRLSGYVDEEKVAIARNYLVPRSLSSTGLTRSDLVFTAGALQEIARGYSREAGVRSFEKNINKISRKWLKELLLDEEGALERPLKVGKDEVRQYLGAPLFDDQPHKYTKSGVVVGLAWTSMGGDTLEVEVAALRGQAGLSLTGQMGDVMKESATIAFTHVRALEERLRIDSRFFEMHHIHLHIPEGATPKDGPSAGITMATAFVSLALDKKVPTTLAMTGELSLTGKVLPIGGLREKVVAASRQKIRDIIIPEKNKRDLDEIPERSKRGISFHLVKNFEDVVKIVFPDISL